MILTLVGCSSSSSNEAKDSETEGENGETGEKITLKLGTYFANTSTVWTGYTEPWIKRVEELTDGKVEFDVYPSEQLGKAHDMLKLTRDRVMDIGVYPTNYFPDNMPLGNMLAGMPNLSESVSQGTRAFNELVQTNAEFLETDYLKNGVRPIMTLVSPTFEVWTTGKEIRVPEDLNGLKVRTPGGVTNEVYEYMGVVPVAVPHPEVYEAIEKGVIEAHTAYSNSLISNGTHELLKYAIYPHIGTAIHALHINEEVWQSLPKDVQDAMILAGEEAMDRMGELYLEEEVKFQEEFKAAGGTIAELTPEEEEKWRNITEEFTKVWLEEHKSDGPPYEEVLNQYKELLEKYKDS